MAESMVQAFDARAAGYDAWYDSPPGSDIFVMEEACLRTPLSGYPRPHLEVGTGSGRFSQALEIAFGVDPAPALLGLARDRDIGVARGVGGHLPYPQASFGGVLIALTLSFVHDPAGVLAEARRVLRPGGGLVLGLVLRESPWAQHYMAEGRSGHPLYRHASFLSRSQVERLLRRAGFTLVAYRSTLFAPPGLARYQVEDSFPGYHESAGFTAVEARR